MCRSAKPHVRRNSAGSAIEGVEVIHGLENIIRLIVQSTFSVKEGLDICADNTWPKVQIETAPITQAYTDLKKRGIRIRFITEITAENISYCKEVMKFAEVRHLDGLMGGGWGVSESQYIAPIPPSSKGEPVTKCIHSTVKEVIGLQQYIINSLWAKAIPAKQRMKEIEEGAKREFVETIRDPYEIQKIGFDLIKKAEDEILILFSTANAFRRQEKSDVLLLLKEAASRGVKVRILVPLDNNIKTEERVQKLREKENSGIDIRDIKKSLDTKLTTMIVDQESSLTVELKDDTRERSDEAIGLATYSNSEPTVFSYASIFENLWIQTELQRRQ